MAVYIRWLREKLEDDPSNPTLIRTVWGVGYEFLEDGRIIGEMPLPNCRNKQDHLTPGSGFHDASGSCCNRIVLWVCLADSRQDQEDRSGDTDSRVTFFDSYFSHNLKKYLPA